MKTLPPRWLRPAAFAVGVALLTPPVLRGLGLLDLWGRVNGAADGVFRFFGLVLLFTVASALWLLQRRRPDLEGAFAQLFVVGLCGATLMGSFGQFSWWLELFSHFRLQYAAGLLGGALYFGARGNPRVALSAAAMAAANLYVVSPQLLSWPTLAAHRGETVRLAMANLHKRNRDTESVIRFIAREGPDVLVLEEFTPEWHSNLESFLRSYPHSVVVPRDDGHGIALYSRRPVLSSEILHFAGAGVPAIAARVDVRGRPLLIVGAHPPAPRNARQYRVRNRIYAGLSDLARASAEPIVILGDLNSTPWGQSFGKLLEDGRLQDTSAGRGLQWSWPSGFWPLAIPIDHCLTSPGVRVASRRMGSPIGSDHYPLLVELAVDFR